MLSIRQTQLSALQSEADRRFELRVVVHLQEFHAREVAGLGSEQIKRRVREAAARARAYGMTWQSTITAFVAYTFVLAERFDDNPSIQKILADDGTEPNARIDRLLREMRHSHWVDEKIRST